MNTIAFHRDYSVFVTTLEEEQVAEMAEIGLEVGDKDGTNPIYFFATIDMADV